MKLDLQGVQGVKTRYLVGGAWNAAVGSLVFAAVWWLFGTAISIWAVTLIAHTLATTHAFFVQRHYVFQRSGSNVWQQLGRFQFAYICIGVLTAFFIAALQVQGLHPIIAQIISITLVAFGGYFSGQNFTFSDNQIDLRLAVGNAAQRIWRLRGALAFFVVSMLLFDYIWGERFYIERTHVGHDFAFSALSLLEGKNWIAANGLMAGLFNPPWFTPAWCAGAAYFADPQSSFYSPIQFLAFVVDPMRAAYYSVLLFAALAFWGSFAIARIVFKWGETASVIFAVLGMANAFVPLRSAVGETAYQPLYIWTLLALAMCWPVKERGLRSVTWPSLCIGLCLTAWLQFGFAGMMIPAFLAALALSLVMVLYRRAELSLIVMRCGAGVVMALLLNASRLYESASLLKNFPRDFYLMPGMATLRDTAMSVLYALIQPSDWTARFGLQALVNVQFTALPHEWALNFGLGALAVCVVAGLIARPWTLAANTRLSLRAIRAPQWFALISLIVIVSLPFAMLWADGGLRSVIKSIPILSSTTWPMRWIVILLPVTQMLLALPLQLLPQSNRTRGAWVVAALAAGAIWIGPFTEPLDYYLNPAMQPYDPRPVTASYGQIALDGPLAISRVVRSDENGLALNRNDAMLSGASEVLCYNPIYGYRLESLPGRERLTTGSATGGAGQSLILNPACLVHPTENSCQPGAGFNLSKPVDRQNAEQFVQRKPPTWIRTFWGDTAAVVSQLTFWILVATILMRTWQAITAKTTRSRQRVS
jgi:hypothetical protein